MPVPFPQCGDSGTSEKPEKNAEGQCRDGVTVVTRRDLKNLILNHHYVLHKR